VLGAEPRHDRIVRQGRRRTTAATAVAGALIAAASFAPPSGGPVAAATFSCTSAGALRYAVVSGDSWFGIASRAGVGVGEVLEVNDAGLDAQLHPGDVLCLPQGAALGSTCAPGAATYTVRSGDGWFGIAQRAGVTSRSLLDANGAAAERALHPGDELCLPVGAAISGSSSAASTGSAGTAGGGRYAVVAGDSWFRIASRAGVPMRTLLAANGATAETRLRPGDEVALPSGAVSPASSAGTSSKGGAAGRYTVVSGDSWFGIAAAAGVPGRALLAANDARATTPLHPGDQITLPAGADTSALRERERGARTVTLAALPTQGPCWYGDTWLDARAGGRRHVGVDLFTKRGEYVYAVVDGTLTGRSWDQPGRSAGNAWWLRAADGSATFFYAHLQDFAPGLREGSRVRAGEIIGWVGDTGNASAVHLHFEVRPGGGDPVNPYPIIRALGGCNRGTPYTQPGGWVPDLID
jgi:murein DD-endopeptidase MepM/ murein hydrolase activator NlpD